MTSTSSEDNIREAPTYVDADIDEYQPAKKEISKLELVLVFFWFCYKATLAVLIILFACFQVVNIKGGFG